jgi:hypothetical protein
MPVRMGWGDADQSYVYVQFMGNWTWSEFYQVQRDISAMIDDSPRPIVSVMINLADTRHVPSRPLQHLMNIGKHWHPRCDMMVFTGMPPMLAPFIEMFLAHFPELRGRVKITDTHRHATDELIDVDDRPAYS